MTPSSMTVKQAEDAWAEVARLTVAARRKEEQLRQQLTKAVADAAPVEAIKSELVTLTNEKSQLQVEAYISGDPAGSRIGELEKLIASLEAKLSEVNKTASVARAAVERLRTRVAGAEQLRRNATNREIAAKEAWAAIKLATLEAEIDRTIDSLCAPLAAIAALQRYLPPPKHYPTLGITLGDAGQDILDQLRKLTAEYPKPSRPFTQRWLNERSISSLPGVGSAREDLEAEVRDILGDGA